jgi:hypothetical protein
MKQYLYNLFMYLTFIKVFLQTPERGGCGRFLQIAKQTVSLEKKKQIQLILSLDQHLVDFSPKAWDRP